MRVVGGFSRREVDAVKSSRFYAEFHVDKPHRIPERLVHLPISVEEMVDRAMEHGSAELPCGCRAVRVERQRAKSAKYTACEAHQ